MTSNFFSSIHHSQKESLSGFLEVKQLEWQYLKPKNIRTAFREVVSPQVDLSFGKIFMNLSVTSVYRQKNHSNL